jgi:MYXO-CTERM domain-containing protein
MKSFASLALAAALSLVSAAALADVPNPPTPCDMLKAGDPCTDSTTMKAGVCKADPNCSTSGCLLCDTSGTTSSSSGAGGGGSSAGGSSGGGCSVAPVGVAGAAPLVAALALLGASTLRRRRSRG